MGEGLGGEWVILQAAMQFELEVGGLSGGKGGSGEVKWMTRLH